MSDKGLAGAERRSAALLASIFGLRMFGLFMLYPVFSVYARRLPGATPALIGIALGIYGLTQAGLQLPFGWASDRLGRRPIIGAGLLIFVAGSVVAALSHGIGGVIFGRAIQGAGAVGSAILALAADLTRPEQRTKAIAIIGAGIGLAFAAALVAGPAVNAWGGLAGIFWLTAALGAAGFVVLWWLVPAPERSRRHRETEAIPSLLRPMLVDRRLIRLYVSIFVLHAMLIALFLAVPVILWRAGGLEPHTEWLFYLPVLAIGFIAMIPPMIAAESRGRMKSVLVGAILVLSFSAAALAFAPRTLLAVAAALLCFFSAFTLLETLLPSLVSRFARPEAKGTALGIYSTSQFLGIFVGGALGGWIQSHYGTTGVFVFVAAAGLGWAFPMFGFRAPRRLSARTMTVDVHDEDEARRLARALKNVPGVEEATVFADDGVAYLRVDRASLDEAALEKASGEAFARMGALANGGGHGNPGSK